MAAWYFTAPLVKLSSLLFRDTAVYTKVEECTGWGRPFWQSGKCKFGFNSHLRLASLPLNWRLAGCNYFWASLGSGKTSKWKLTLQAAIFSDLSSGWQHFQPPVSLVLVLSDFEHAKMVPKFQRDLLSSHWLLSDFYPLLSMWDSLDEFFLPFVCISLPLCLFSSPINYWILVKQHSQSSPRITSLWGCPIPLQNIPQRTLLSPIYWHDSSLPLLNVSLILITYYL